MLKRCKKKEARHPHARHQDGGARADRPYRQRARASRRRRLEWCFARSGMAYGWAWCSSSKGAWATASAMCWPFSGVSSPSGDGRRLHLGHEDRQRDLAMAMGRRPKAMIDPAHDLVLLDELNIVLRYDHLPLEEVVEVLKGAARPACDRYRAQCARRGDRDRRPRHRDDGDQASVPQRREGAEGIGV